MTSDFALLGATGFTGRLTARYLASHAPSDARWSIAGRNRAALEEVAADIADSGGVVPEVVQADVTDASSLRSLAESTRVLTSTVGPYAKYGEPVVAAAAEAGIAYADLTGEPEFVDRMWLEHHATAEKTGARLVHACGFDSIPHDIGVYHTVSQLPAVPVTVRGYVRVRAAFSAGTYQSALGAFADLRSSATTAKERRRLEPRPQGRRVRGLPDRPARGDGGKGWALPLPTIDPQIVLRSARALDAYGPDFAYGHYAQFERLATAVGSAVGLGTLVAAAQLPPVARRLEGLQKSGDGPSERRRERSWFRVRFVAETAGGETLVTEAAGGDPGYTETSRMLGESTLALAFDDLPDVAGQVTTAVAMGDALLARLPYFRVL